MGSKYTKRYTEEFKRDAIALVDSTTRTVTEVARDLGISPESLHGWYKQARAAEVRATPASSPQRSRRSSSGCASSLPSRPKRSRSCEKPASFFAKESDR
ncbi:transposase [Streptomyces melanogenes]|uniref:transposase n=1 Tax=Streptomyces melanogenes TaxID=67326 RepID=UPI00167C9972|nr:hypothetical protein GCM10010278_86230 [Streptomyces melanogenes]